MTSYGTGNTRFYSTLEEAKAAGKPIGKDSWELYAISGFDRNGQPVTVYGWTGGAAVLGWQVATHFGWTATKAESSRKVDPRAVLAGLGAAEREALLREFLPAPAANDQVGELPQEPAKRGKK
jgi:hypothetical protein